MSNPGDSGCEEAYAALADETRVRILLALAERYDEAWSSEWPSFSELREQVGVDDTSRFSYHLEELQETFVRKVDGRYLPQVAALEIVSAIRAGTYDSEPATLSEHRTEYGCPQCEQDLVASYGNHLLYVGCSTHGAAVAYPTPPRAVARRTMSETIDISLRRHACDIRLLRTGTCPHCWGVADLSFPRDAVPESYLYDEPTYASAACESCWLSYPLPVAHTVLGHPAVETMYADHGLGPVDAQLGPHNLARVGDVVLPKSGPAARVTIELAEESLVCELDADCRVVTHWHP